MDRLADEYRNPIDYWVGARLGKGGLGAVFEATDRHGNPTGMAYKELSDQSLAPHAQRVLSYIGSLPDLCRRMPAIPTQYVVRPNTGALGLLLRKVPGEELSLKLVVGKPLASKLRLAMQLAVSVGILHAHGIVHADINDPNIMVDGYDLNLIDIDTCGVLQPNLVDYYPDLAARVRGKAESPVIISNPSTRIPDASIQTDLCNLAVELNLILLHPANPTILLGASDDEISRNTRRWPPDTSELPPTQHKQLAKCVTALKRLDPQLQDNFTNLFDRKGSNQFDPANAVAARQWAVDLYQAWRTVATCTNPKCTQTGTEYVALGGRDCPFCDAGSFKWGTRNHGSSGNS